MIEVDGWNVLDVWKFFTRIKLDVLLCTHSLSGPQAQLLDLKADGVCVCYVTSVRSVRIEFGCLAPVPEDAEDLIGCRRYVLL